VRPNRSAMSARLAPLVGGDIIAYRDAFIAFLVAAAASLVAGLTLATTTGTLEDLPGLLLLVPAALAVKGNIFGALGSRLGTSIHAGVFQVSPRLDTVVGQNAAAALVLSLVTSVEMAMLAKGVAIVFDISPSMTLVDFVAVSVAGGVLASLVVLVITLALASSSVKFGWDLDNVVAPLVTATGDLITLPALVLAASLAGLGSVTVAITAVSVVLSVIGVIWALRAGLRLLHTVMRESVPILTMAVVIDLIAGISIEKRLSDFVEYPVLLILLPGFLSTAGALGGVLSSRLATKVHLGLLHPEAIPRGQAGPDVVMVVSLSIPIFAIAGGMAEVGGLLTGSASPGLAALVAVSVLGGLLACAAVVLVAYYATVVAIRFGLDPDTYGMPMVTSSLDLVGTFALILALVAVGVA
jgi:mgtE-like transporter